MTKPKDETDVDVDSILAELGSFGKYQLITYSFILLPIMFSAIYTSQYIFNAGALEYSLQELRVHLDPILDEVGHFGRYQIIVYTYVLVAIIATSMQNSQYVFNAAKMLYRCKVPECESSPPEFETSEWGLWALPESGGRCERLVPLDGECTPFSFHMNETKTCSAWIYESRNTIVAEFDLACEEWKRTLVGTIHNAGVFAALAITALISDTFGRKTAFIATAVAGGVLGVIRSFSNSYPMYLTLEFLEAAGGAGVYSTGFILAFIATAVAGGVLGVIRSFSNSYPMYLTLEFLEAAGGAGVYSTGFILALEMVGQKRRVLGGNIISSTFAFGQVVMALAAWAFPYWRTLTLVVYAPSILFILYYFCVEESVRWLLSKGRKKEAARIIFKAAAVNKKKLSPASIKMLTEEPEEQTKPVSLENHAIEESKKPSVFIQVLKSKTLMTRVCICSFWWITLTFVYYGLSINSVSLAGNMYVNYILTSLVEIPGYFISFLTLDRYGRKRSIITAFFICGIALIILPFIPVAVSWLQITLNMIGKLSISMAFSSIYIYTSELFPTEARHSLLGACSMFGRIGSLLAPQTPLLVSMLSIITISSFVHCTGAVTNTLAMLGKLSISMNFASIYIYTLELFPTYARHSLMNSCSMIGRIGSMVAPQTPLLVGRSLYTPVDRIYSMEYMESLPYLIFGIMAACSGCLMLLTPETLRSRLPDTVAQAENISGAPQTKRPNDVIVE